MDRNQAAASNRADADGALEGDERLWIAAAKAAPREFGPLYERYFDQVFHYISSRVARRADAEDLVSAIFLGFARPARV
jgi:DNA-directed RNA polymerase specialized sigma24 family protein